MDSNKDEGVRCFEIGKAALERGDKVRALKFLKKAHRLYPNSQVDSLLRVLNDENGKQGSEETVSENGNSHRSRATGDDNGESSVSNDSRADNNTTNGVHHSNGLSGSGSSAEHVEVVRRIKRTKNYYEILGLSKDCTEEDIRKAYRKLSLKVHPDKNKSQGAEEAFKAVSKAFHCLSDEERRAKYDQYPEGEDGTDAVQHPYMRRRHGHSMYYEDVFDANDIFNSFFFGMQNQNAAFRRAQFVRTPDARAGRTDIPSNNFVGLLQLLPIFALFALSFFPFSQPVYSLDAQSPYTFLQVTKEHKVTYYVRSSTYDRDYPVGSSSRRNVEAQVERDYTDLLIHRCRLERSYSWRPRGQIVENSYCAKLQQFGVRVVG